MMFPVNFHIKILDKYDNVIQKTASVSENYFQIFKKYLLAWVEYPLLKITVSEAKKVLRHFETFQESHSSEDLRHVALKT